MLTRETMSKAERKLLASTIGRTPEVRRRRDSVAVGWLLVATSLGIAAGLAWVARTGGW